MPVNRNALIRFRTIDKCLQNRYRKWTLEDLIEACSEALYEYEGIDKGVSRRTVQADIQMMRSNKLGYNAPITVVDKKHYTYEDPNYSITNIPITDQDLGKLSEAVALLKQFKGFPHFQDVEGMIQKLEAHVYAQKTKQQPVIDFEKNEHLKGLEYLDQLYQDIIQKRAIHITYQSFKARQASSFDFHPYLLKEFRNRWFVIGAKGKQKQLLTLALDRIIDLAPTEAQYHHNDQFNPATYFRDAIGVTINPNQEPEEVILFVTYAHAPYVLTKPFHHSQKLLERDNHGITISLTVQHNFELEKDILGFGDGIRVIGPNRLKARIKDRLRGAMDLYQTELTESGLVTLRRKLRHRGFGILKHVYTSRALKKLKKYLGQLVDEGKPLTPQLLIEDGGLRNLIVNPNFHKILDSVQKNAEIVDAGILTLPPRDNDLEWKQKHTLLKNKRSKEQPEALYSFLIFMDDCGLRQGNVQVVPGSHKAIHTPIEIDLITSNSTPVDCEVAAGGVLMTHSLLIQRHALAKSQKRRYGVELVMSP